MRLTWGYGGGVRGGGARGGGGWTVVDVPTSPDHPMAKSVGWVERVPEAATPMARIPAANYKTSPRRTRTPWHGREQQSGAAPDRSASQLNQQELGRLSPGPGVPSR